MEQISLDNFKSGRLHTLLTNAISHFESDHLISNMIGLYFFGTSVSYTLSFMLLVDISFFYTRLHPISISSTEIPERT